MKVTPLGDSAWLVEIDGLANAAALAEVMSWTEALKYDRPSYIMDVVPSFTSLAVYYDAVDGREARQWMEERLARASSVKAIESREFEIPVCYDGEDLAEVAAFAGLSPEDVIELHGNADYIVAAVGFSPGFPYLLGLPPQLRVPRRTTPRLKVPGGSVAIAGGQAGIYPFDSPGGWQVLGRTNTRLFNPLTEPPALLHAGDRVRFKRVAALAAVDEKVPDAPDLTGFGVFEVLSPGAMTTIQDGGRYGWGASGVSPNGATDVHSLRMANLLVGNPPETPCLDICMSGPVLRFHSRTTIAVASGSGKSRPVAVGEVVDLSRMPSGVRACVGIAGGLIAQEHLGSASTDLAANFGGWDGRKLQTGDQIYFHFPGPVPKCGNWHVGKLGKPPQSIELRFIRGVQEDWFGKSALTDFRESIYHVTPRSDRMGARLSGQPLRLAQPREMVSQPVACGSVQVPPDGQPIVLLAGRQTIGGYPQIGHVVSVDLPKLARAWPGTAVRFREVTLEEAWELKRCEERNLAWLKTGLELLK